MNRKAAGRGDPGSSGGRANAGSRNIGSKSGGRPRSSRGGGGRGAGGGSGGCGRNMGAPRFNSARILFGNSIGGPASGTPSGRKRKNCTAEGRLNRASTSF